MKTVKLLLTIVGIVSLLATSLQVNGYVASSTNYRLERDSVNAFGELSTSTNYSLEDTGGELASGTSSSATYIVKAGYQQMEVVSIAITSPGDVTLAPNIGVSGGTADGSTSWTVTTNNDTGYVLKLEATTNPAMQSGANSFANYSSGVSYPWSVVAASKEFGFTPEGTDITATYKDNGSTCGSGSSNVSTCWDSITTTAKTIASRSTSNAGAGGTATTVRFRAEAGATSAPTAANYSATIIATAVTQ